MQYQRSSFVQAWKGGVGLVLAMLLLLLPMRALAQAAVTGGKVPCQNGHAGPYDCQGIDLLSLLPIDQLGGSSETELADIWGWTDPQSSREYALVARTDGTAFVDVTAPENPVYLGELPRHEGTEPDTWRDVKVYSNHAYVVADGRGNRRGQDGQIRGHGLQVFDLTQLRDVENPPVTFEETAHYDRFGSAHNVFINDESGFAYVTGIQGPQDLPASYPNTGYRRCGPGLHMINLEDPANPTFAGCFTDTNQGVISTGYTHDVQCVVYQGPDQDYEGREICIGSNEDVISLVDVTDKAHPVPVAQAGYPDFAYVHQGWLTEDQRYFLQDDELDEVQGKVDSTRTLIWDLEDLDDPVLLEQYLGPVPAIDHNQYILDDRAYQANYASGLRVLDISNVAQPREVRFFDTFPAHDRPTFQGAWSNYPFFESGNIIVSSIGEGLFVLRPSTGAPPPPPEAFALRPAAPNPFTMQTTLELEVPERQHIRVEVYDLLGRRIATLEDDVLEAGRYPLTLHAQDWPAGTYVVRATSERGVQTQLLTLAR